ncbi:hypothetical protein B566_EDAN009401 [Ephemera danica]|nr:hypothetical protein B566_EDAN009401 [Ephemera danica]
MPIAMQLRTHAMNLFLRSEEKGLSLLQVVPMKEAWKWACSQRIAAGVNKQASSGAVCDFLVNLHVEYAEDKAECQPLQEIHGDKFVERRRESRKFRGEMFTRQSVEALLENTEAEKFKLVYTCPPVAPNEAAKYGRVICSHNACFIAGRYNKFSRELSQTPWVVEGDRRMEGSVQELISKSLETIAKSKSSKFLSSGREDVDVRTLGRGRPFAIELADPHRTQFTAEDLAELQKSINKSSNMLIAVRDLQLINKDELVELKSGEEEKCKDYEAFCVSLGAPVDPQKLEALQTMKDIVLSQKTPIRVLHRRPLATRSRTVFSMAATVVDEMHFKLKLRTQAGTYIKEFVHGDFGRTLPNLGTLLGTPVDILALDVQQLVIADLILLASEE